MALKREVQESHPLFSWDCAGCFRMGACTAGEQLLPHASVSTRLITLHRAGRQSTAMKKPTYSEIMHVINFMQTKIEF